MSVSDYVELDAAHLSKGESHFDPGRAVVRDMPSVSVIIPTFNYDQFLASAIRSVLSQTFQDFELIVVDDGSTDDTREVVAQFESDCRVRYIFQTNRGDAAARNTGISHARGGYLAFLDSDDYWMPDKLERQMDVLRSNPKSCAVHSAVYLEYVDCEQRIVSRHFRGRPPLREKSVYEQLLYTCVITGSNSSVLLSRDVLNEVGLYDEGLRGLADHDLWLRITHNHEFHYLDIPLTCVRKHGSSLSANLDDIAQDTEQLLKKFDRDIPRPLRYHLPRIRTRLYLGLAWKFARRWRWAPACFYAAKTTRYLVRCPLFAVRFLGRKLSDRLRERFAESIEYRSEMPQQNLLRLRIVGKTPFEQVQSRSKRYAG